MFNDSKLMNNVKVKRQELLHILETNLSSHKEDVLDALELRRQEMKEYFRTKLEKMERDESYDPKENITFRKPVDSSKDYERAIRMVELTQDEIIELTEGQFDKLVMDNWEWKDQLIATSQIYGKTI